MFEDVTVIIPTLNEAWNLPVLLNIIQNFYPNIKIIISDDGSSDGTINLIKEYQKNNKNLLLVDRTKENIHGVCISVIEAAKKAKTNYIIVMDGDLQHPPEKITEIYNLLKENNDIVIGTRQKIKNWKKSRKLISQLATLLGKLSLFARGKKLPKDILSGFFGIKTDFLQNLIKKNSKSFQLKGYKILFDILKKSPRGVKITEVPYHFGQRNRGESKIRKEHMLIFLKSLVSR
jgi:dolichol-phosphate mannosyltransferase